MIYEEDGKVTGWPFFLRLEVFGSLQVRGFHVEDKFILTYIHWGKKELCLTLTFLNVF